MLNLGGAGGFGGAGGDFGGKLELYMFQLLI